MRITFKDVRIEKEKTYFFFPSIDGAAVKHCLSRDGITNFEIVGARQYRTKLPPEIIIPTVKMNGYAPADAVCPLGLTCVLISNMNIDDLQFKLNQIQRHEDDELEGQSGFRIVKPNTN